MSDNTLTVYQFCKHGEAKAHTWFIDESHTFECPGGREIVGELVWICVATGQWFEYIEEEWIEIFGAVPTDTCPECGRHYTNQGCDWYYKVPTR